MAENTEKQAAPAEAVQASSAAKPAETSQESPAAKPAEAGQASPAATKPAEGGQASPAATKPAEAGQASPAARPARAGQSGPPRSGSRPRSRSPQERRRFFRRRKVDFFSVNKIDDINYKDVKTLKQFVGDRGKILPRRHTGLSALHQRMLRRAIKRARNIALLPFVGDIDKN